MEKQFGPNLYMYMYQVHMVYVMYGVCQHFEKKDFMTNTLIFEPHRCFCQRKKTPIMSLLCVYASTPLYKM